MATNESLFETVVGLLILGVIVFKVFPPLVRQLDINPIFQIALLLIFILGVLQLVGEFLGN